MVSRTRTDSCLVKCFSLVAGALKRKYKYTVLLNFIFAKFSFVVHALLDLDHRSWVSKSYAEPT